MRRELVQTRDVQRAWWSLAALPVVFVGGFALAHIAYVIWPQFEEGAGGEPWWFMLIALVLSYIPIAPVLYIGIKASVVNARLGSASAWIPLTIFVGFIVWQLMVIVAGFTGAS